MREKRSIKCKSIDCLGKAQTPMVLWTLGSRKEKVRKGAVFHVQLAQKKKATEQTAGRCDYVRTLSVV